MAIALLPAAARRRGANIFCLQEVYKLRTWEVNRAVQGHRQTLLTRYTVLATGKAPFTCLTQVMPAGVGQETGTGIVSYVEGLFNPWELSAQLMKNCESGVNVSTATWNTKI